MTKALLCLLAAALFLSGCAAKIALNMKGDTPPPLKYCSDAVGHVPNTVPWILGGTCCCTPDETNFKRAQSEGTVKADTTYAGYLNLYKSRDIVCDLDHKGCNNLCDHGPHVVFGGGCMATPTPGTDNYEEVASGIRKVTGARSSK